MLIPKEKPPITVVGDVGGRIAIIVVSGGVTGLNTLLSLFTHDIAVWINLTGSEKNKFYLLFILLSFVLVYLALGHKESVIILFFFFFFFLMSKYYTSVHFNSCQLQSKNMAHMRKTRMKEKNLISREEAAGVSAAVERAEQ